MAQTIGQRLKAEREGQRLTLEKVFEATRIRVQYLHALEEDDLSVMPSPVQARGYLRNYAEYLGFDVDQVLQELREMNAQQPNAEVIGPVDPSAVPLPQESKEAGIQPEVTTHQLLDLDQDQPVDNELMAPIKPSPSLSLPDAARQTKPARRKKAASEPKPASVEPLTRRRGRKNVEPDALPVVEADPDWPRPVEETAVTTEVPPHPQPVEQTVAPTEVPPQLESIDVKVEEQQEGTPQNDVGDSLWQTWLNRVGSIVSARARRRTLTPKESSLSESEPMIVSPEVAVEAKVQETGSETYKQILKEIGAELRQRRELLSLHFDEVERNTHVKAYYLEALERGALDELPSTVQTRGMLSNYATFLDLDVDALLLRFADALQARHRERNPQKPARKPGQPILANMPPVRTFIAGDMIFGVGMAILLVGFAIWGVSRVMTLQSQEEVEPTAPSISDVLLSYPNPSLSTPTATFLPAVEAFPGEATVTLEIPTQNVNAPVQLNLVAVERTYMRVTVDGEVGFDGRVVPGNAYPFDAENQIEVLVGSGAAIRIVYNGRDLGLMGTFGQVVNNIYLGTGVVTPTGLPTLTPSITTTPTATPRFSATPAPSVTAVP